MSGVICEYCIVPGRSNLLTNTVSSPSDFKPKFTALDAPPVPNINAFYEIFQARAQCFL